MTITDSHAGLTADIITVFRAVFAASDGAAEGEAIAGLVAGILATGPPIGSWA